MMALIRGVVESLCRCAKADIVGDEILWLMAGVKVCAVGGSSCLVLKLDGRDRLEEESGELI